MPPGINSHSLTPATTGKSLLYAESIAQVV